MQSQTRLGLNPTRSVVADLQHTCHRGLFVSLKRFTVTALDLHQDSCPDEEVWNFKRKIRSATCKTGLSVFSPSLLPASKASFRVNPSNLPKLLSTVAENHIAVQTLPIIHSGSPTCVCNISSHSYSVISNPIFFSANDLFLLHK